MRKDLEMLFCFPSISHRIYAATPEGEHAIKIFEEMKTAYSKLLREEQEDADAPQGSVRIWDRVISRFRKKEPVATPADDIIQITI